jgi:predicted nucleotidyltransferase component of viral defense system
MNRLVLQRIKDAHCTSLEEELGLIREIVQEISLLGLWRAKFYEKACFYGGTALRILHGLQRFSEDLDFSLLKSEPHFDLTKYENAIQRELEAFGFKVSVERKIKNVPTRIESAFIKGNTLIHLLEIQSIHKVHKEAVFKVKIELDVDPPLSFETSVHSIFWPIPFSVKAFSLEDLFAGKMHACLCRSERNNIKGRDWFDFLWYVGTKTPLHLKHLEDRMVQSQHLSAGTQLTSERLQVIFEKKVSEIDFAKAKRDVIPFIKRASDLDAWSQGLFKEAFRHISFL